MSCWVEHTLILGHLGQGRKRRGPDHPEGWGAGRKGQGRPPRWRSSHACRCEAYVESPRAPPKDTRRCWRARNASRCVAVLPGARSARSLWFACRVRVWGPPGKRGGQRAVPSRGRRVASCHTSPPRASPSSLPWTLPSLRPSRSHSTCLLGSTLVPPPAGSISSCRCRPPPLP